MPGHEFYVVALDGNPVPRPNKVKVLQLENRRDKADSERETRTAEFGQTILEPFLVFLRLALTSFGGALDGQGERVRNRFAELGINLREMFSI